MIIAESILYFFCKGDVFANLSISVELYKLFEFKMRREVKE